MRLSAELIGSCEQRTNPLGEREVVFRGLAIPMIEHLAVTRDAFDAMDFTDNRLSRLENFPRLLRLSSLTLSGNVIETVDTNNMMKNTPSLQNLDMSNNKISSLFEVSNLAKACTKLEFLNLNGNPVQRRQHYRLYTIKRIPSLKVLDNERITKSERDRADRLANSAAGAALESDVQDEGRISTTNNGTGPQPKTFTPGEGESAEESFVVNFTPEEKERIRLLVANAKSPQEIEDIERSVKRGMLPKGAEISNDVTTTTTTTTATATVDSTTNAATVANESATAVVEETSSKDESNDNSRKRPAPEETGDGEVTTTAPVPSTRKRTQKKAKQ